MSRIDIRRPSVARTHDALLGGFEHYAVDREACRRLWDEMPEVEAVTRASRVFLQRAVTVLARDHGVDQFLDLGCGVPVGVSWDGNVRDIARRHVPGARTVYVDTDPLTLAHARTTLEEDDEVAVVDADFREVAALFEHGEVRRLVLPGRATAVLLSWVLHEVPDADDPAALLDALTQRLSPGSFLVLSHLVSDDERQRDPMTALLHEVTDGAWGRVRAPGEVAAWLADRRPLPPADLCQDPGQGALRGWGRVVHV